MSVELLQTLSVVSFIAAGTALLVAIALFFLLNIKKVVGDLSGATARKAIRNIRQQNENAVDNDNNAATAKITPSGRIERQLAGMAGSPSTEKFATTELAASAQETTLLGPASNETTILTPASNETTILDAESGVTRHLQMVLPAPAMQSVSPMTNENALSQTPPLSAVFEKEVEMSFTDSSEIIE